MGSAHPATLRAGIQDLNGWHPMAAWHCHAGRMNPIPQERNRFDEKKPFHELAIGCERCHGPGKKHIHFHEENHCRLGTNVDPIVNPEKLSPELRDAVCYQCHLQG